MDLFSLFLQSPPTSLGHLDFFQWETDASLCVPPPNFKGHILNFLKNNLSFTPGIAKSPIPAFFKSERSQSAFCRHHNIWQRAPLFWPRKRKYPPPPPLPPQPREWRRAVSFLPRKFPNLFFFFFKSDLLLPGLLEWWWLNGISTSSEFCGITFSSFLPCAGKLFHPCTFTALDFCWTSKTTEKIPFCYTFTLFSLACTFF